MRDSQLFFCRDNREDRENREFNEIREFKDSSLNSLISLISLISLKAIHSKSPPYFSSEVVRCGALQKKSPRDSTKHTARGFFTFSHYLSLH